MSVAMVAAMVFVAFSVAWLSRMAIDAWAERGHEIKSLRDRLGNMTAARDEWRARANPHEATRAEWQRATAENSDLRDAKAALRRRLRGVLRQARAWKSEAVSRGWTPAEDRAAWQALRAMRAEAKARRRAAAKAMGR